MNKKALVISCLLLGVGLAGSNPALTQTRKSQTIQSKTKPKVSTATKAVVTPAKTTSRADELNKNKNDFRATKCIEDIEAATGYKVSSHGTLSTDKDAFLCKVKLTRGNTNVYFNLQDVGFGANGQSVTFGCKSGKGKCVSGQASTTQGGLPVRNTPKQDLVQCFEFLSTYCTPF